MRTSFDLHRMVDDEWRGLPIEIELVAKAFAGEHGPHHSIRMNISSGKGGHEICAYVNAFEFARYKRAVDAFNAALAEPVPVTIETEAAW